METGECLIYTALILFLGLLPDGSCESVTVTSKNTNPALEGQKFSIKITSIDLSPTIATRSKDLRCGVGKTVGNTLQLVSLAKYSFSSNKLSVVSGTSYTSRISIVDKKTMEVKAVKFADHGDQFFCELNVTRLLITGKSSKRSKLHTVSVEGKPALVSPVPSSQYSKKENSSLTITCKFTAYPAMTVDWTWPSTVNPNSKQVNSVKGTRPITFTSQLRLTHLQRGDIASYKCKGKNKHGSSDKTIKVNVLYPPRITTPRTVIYKKCVGENVTIECPVSGNPKPKVKLFRNGIVIGSSDGKLRHALAISALMFGNYSCNAQNSEGKDEVMVELRGKDVATRAPPLKAHASSTAITVTWENVRCLSATWNRTFIIYLKADNGVASSQAVHCSSASCQHVFDQLESGVRYSVAASSVDPQGIAGARSAAIYSTPGEGGDSFPVGAAVGAGVAAVAVLMLVVFLCCCCRRKKIVTIAKSDSEKKLEMMKKSSVTSDAEYEELENSRYIWPSKQGDSVYEALQPSSIRREDGVCCGNQLEIDPCNITIVKQIHNGTFWNVHQATLLRGNNKQTGAYWTVAVKMWKGVASAPERKEICRRIELMSLMGTHRNVLSTVGIVSTEDPPRIVVEYAQHGDLLGFLRKTRGMDDDYYNIHVKPKSYLKQEELTQFAVDVASGMEFLGSKKIVHLALMAKTVMVVMRGEQRICKVSDFVNMNAVEGSCTDRSERQNRAHLKWSALEVLSGSTATMQSDVWSFGVTLFEIYTVGGVPYVNVPSLQMLDVLKAGNRQERPDYVNTMIYAEVASCWYDDPTKRPSFAQLKQFFASRLPKDGANVDDSHKMATSPSNCYDDIEQQEDMREGRRQTSTSDSAAGDHPYDDIGEVTVPADDNDSLPVYAAADDYYTDLNDAGPVADASHPVA